MSEGGERELDSRGIVGRKKVSCSKKGRSEMRKVFFVNNRISHSRREKELGGRKGQSASKRKISGVLSRRAFLGKGCL